MIFVRDIFPDSGYNCGIKLKIILITKQLMMKTMIRFALLLFMGFAFLATSQAQDTKDMTKWDDAKEAYHKVMASTFHPVEEGNFMPLKEKAGELKSVAKEWASVKVPEGLDKKELKKNLKLLVSESSNVEKLVKKDASESDLKAAIFSLHDVFHNIVGLCDH